MKISIFASIGSQNLGDELILKNEVQFFRKQYGENIEFDVFTYDTKNIFFSDSHMRYYEYFPCNIRKIRNIWKNIKNLYYFLYSTWTSDLIVIGGGGIFFDNEVEEVANPLPQWLYRIRVFEMMKKKILFHAVGISLKDRKNMKYIQKIFAGPGKEVTVRDQYSYDILQSLDISAQKVGDPVFLDNRESSVLGQRNYCLGIIQPKSFQVSDLYSYDLKGKSVGIAFRAGYFLEDRASMKDTIEYLQKQGSKIVLLPHSFHSIELSSNDYIFLKQFAQQYQIEIASTMMETYTYYHSNKIDICFAMRLHSIILSQVYSISFIAFSYTTKTQEILELIKKNYDT